MKKISNEISRAIRAIESSEVIALISHVSPDGDNLGSTMAMYLGLKSKYPSKTIIGLKSDKTPENFNFLIGVDELSYYENQDLDLLIVLDCGDEDRLGEYSYLLEKSSMVINIDHHISNPYFGDINIVDSKAAATGELVYDLLQAMGVSLDKSISEAIYTAISSDTGSFKYTNTSSKTHKIASEILDMVDTEKINNSLYESRTLEKTNLLFQAYKNLRFSNNKTIAYTYINEESLKETGATMEDSDGIVEFIRSIDGVELALLFKEKSNEVKVSMRSKSYIDVSEISQSIGGGGHKRAAGASLKLSLEESINLVLREARKQGD